MGNSNTGNNIINSICDVGVIILIYLFYSIDLSLKSKITIKYKIMRVRGLN